MKQTENKNLSIFEEIEKIKEAEEKLKPYKNGLGYLLPWEEQSYLSTNQNATK